MSSPFLTSQRLLDIPTVYENDETEYDGADIERLHKVVRLQVPAALLALGRGVLRYPDDDSLLVSSASGTRISIHAGAAIAGGDTMAPGYVELAANWTSGALEAGRGAANPLYVFVTLQNGDASYETATPAFFIGDSDTRDDGVRLAKVLTDAGVVVTDMRQFLSLGTGDMTKAVYDTTNNGKVDQAELADAAPWSGITGKPATFAPSEHSHEADDISDAGAVGIEVLQAETQTDARTAMGAAAAADLTAHTGAAAPHTGHLDVDGSKALTGNLNAGGHKFTNLAAPTADQDAATKAYADAIGAGLKPKAAVKVAAPGNVNIANPGTATFDTVTLASGEFIALLNQTTAAENGVYTFNGPSSALTRRADLDTSGEMQTGVVFKVLYGASYAGRSFVLVTVGTITLGTTALEFTQWGSDTSVDNDGLNVGTGTGLLYKAKAGLSLLFRTLAAGSTKLAITTVGDVVSIDVNEGNLNLANMGGTLPVGKGGTGFTTLADVKTWLGITVINALKLQGRDVAATAPTEGQALIYDGSEWRPGDTGTGDFRADGTVAMTGTLDLGMQRLINLGTPTDVTDAATKGYVDTMATRRLLPAVRLATATALPAWARDPTNANKLVATANGALSIDGQVVVAGDRVLVCREGAGPVYASDAAGVYTVVAVGDGTHPWSLLRATDADSAAELPYGTNVAVTNGDKWAGFQFVQAQAGTITLNSTPIYWADTVINALPPGGTTGQELIKASDTDGHGIWVDRLVSFVQPVKGTPAADAEILRMKMSLGWTLVFADCTGTVDAANAAAANSVFTVQKSTNNGTSWTSIGTITWGTGAVTPTWAGADTTLLVGHLLRVVGPHVPDSTLKNFSHTIAGVRQ